MPGQQQLPCYWYGGLLRKHKYREMHIWRSGPNMMTSSNGNIFRVTGGCFTNVSRALQNNLAKIHNTRNHIYGENFKLKLGTRTKFQLEILTTSTISAIHIFRENSLESSWNVSETTPSQRWIHLTKASDAELWYFLWSAPEQTDEQTLETPVIRDAIELIMKSL